MHTVAQAQLYLSSSAQATLLSDIQGRSSIEACGVLLGTIDNRGNWRVEQAHPLRNIFNSPVYFEFDPEDLLAIELQYPSQVIGVYHSHPTGFPVASDTDRQNMQRVNQEEQIPWAWLIISGPFNKQSSQQLATIPMIAYHHYAQEGLQHLKIELTRPEEGS